MTGPTKGLKSIGGDALTDIDMEEEVKIAVSPIAAYAFIMVGLIVESTRISDMISRCCDLALSNARYSTSLSKMWMLLTCRSVRA